MRPMSTMHGCYLIIVLSRLPYDTDTDESCGMLSQYIWLDAFLQKGLMGSSQF